MEPISNNTCDLLVIGGGSGGIAAARRAAEYGARVVLCETGLLGGTCVNVGCVPKKVMWNASQVHHSIELANDYGFQIELKGFDWPRLKHARDAYVGRLNQIYADNLDTSGVQLVRAAASLKKPNTVEAGGQTYRAEHIIIATGGRPVVPNIPGVDLAITSDGFFELETMPMKPLIIGAGYIATELAGMLQGLGSQVTMLIRKDKLLRKFDSALGGELMTQMLQSGINITTNTSAKELYRAADGSLGYRTEGKDESGYDCVLFAISRCPNVEELGYETVGITLDRGGFIPVDAYQNTSATGIYAVGDVTPAAPLTPVAIAAGRKLATRVFGNDSHAKLNPGTIPTVVFSHPPIGTIGLSEERAIEEYGKTQIKVYQSRFVNMRYAVTPQHKSATLMKLITVGAEERVTGCHVIGDGADEMMQGFSVAINMGATKTDFDNTIAIHPTAAEEFVTLR